MSDEFTPLLDSAFIPLYPSLVELLASLPGLDKETDSVRTTGRGMLRALVMAQLQYRLSNGRKDRRRVSFDNRTWYVRSYREWQFFDFPFVALPTVKRTFQELRQAGYVLARPDIMPVNEAAVRGVLNRLAYSIDYQRLALLIGALAEIYEAADLAGGRDHGDPGSGSPRSGVGITMIRGRDHGDPTMLYESDQKEIHAIHQSSSETLTDSRTGDDHNPILEQLQTERISQLLTSLGSPYDISASKARELANDPTTTDERITAWLRYIDQRRASGSIRRSASGYLISMLAIPNAWPPRGDKQEVLSGDDYIQGKYADEIEY
jgi:hypothetical protein